MGFFYVDRQGTVRLGRVASRATIKLTDGTILPDPPPNGRMFATEESALKFSECIQKTNGNMHRADELHRQWLEERLHAHAE